MCVLDVRRPAGRQRPLMPRRAAAILGVKPKTVTNLLCVGRLAPATAPGRKIGVFWRDQVEALAAARAERAEQRRRLVEQRLRPSVELPPDQEATFQGAHGRRGVEHGQSGAQVHRPTAPRRSSASPPRTSAGSQQVAGSRGCRRDAQADIRRGCTGGPRSRSSHARGIRACLPEIAHNDYVSAPSPHVESRRR